MILPDLEVDPKSKLGVVAMRGPAGQHTRVLLAADWFLKYSLALAEGLLALGTPTAVLCRDHTVEFGGNEREWRDAIAKIAEAGAEVFILPGRISSPMAIGDIARLGRAVRAWSPDVVHTHDGSDPRFLWIAPRVPTIVTIHDPVPHPGQPKNNWLLRRAQLRWQRRAQAWHVHSERLVPELPPHGGRTVICIPHGSSVRATPLPPPADPTILFFGRLEPYKGLSVLAAALPSVWSTCPTAKVIIAGQGSDSTQFPDDDRVELRRRYVPEDEIESLLREATVVALPYTQASQSGVAALALGAGVPVVASDLGALPDVVPDRWLVPPGEPEQLAVSLGRALEFSLSDRVGLLRDVSARYSWPVVAAAFREAYLRL